MHTIQFRITVPTPIERIAVRLLLAWRRLRFGYPFRRIPLTRGKFAIVDPDDYHRLARHKWHLAVSPTSTYAVRWSRSHATGKRRRIWMHRQIINVPPHLLCDHINNNGLDNRKANLRPATFSQNTAHRPKSSAKTRSIYKGLEFDKKQKKWKARIQVNNKKIYLGSFSSELAAARAYDRAARQYHKDFAQPNLPVPVSPRHLSAVSLADRRGAP